VESTEGLARAGNIWYNGTKAKQEKRRIRTVKKTVLPSLPDDAPEEFRQAFSGKLVFDSSCSDTARVFFIDAEGGFFLKKAPKDALREEAAMTDVFFRAGFGPEMLAYRSADADWMLTRRIRGEDGTHFADRPELLCDLLGDSFRRLHEDGLKRTDASLLKNRTAQTAAAAGKGLAKGIFHDYLRTERYGIRSAEDARKILEDLSGFAPSVLIHGDACLPNVLIDGEEFAGFIDCGAAGYGNRHSDLFWTLWSLAFNLKTDSYGDRFLDAYGRDAVVPEMLTTAAALEAVAE
jgi:kanamycin kinase